MDTVARQFLLEHCADRCARRRSRGLKAAKESDCRRQGLCTEVPSRIHEVGLDPIRKGDAAAAEGWHFECELRHQPVNTFKSGKRRQWTRDTRVAAPLTDPLVDLLKETLQRKGFYANYAKSNREFRREQEHALSKYVQQLAAAVAEQKALLASEEAEHKRASVFPLLLNVESLHRKNMRFAEDEARDEIVEKFLSSSFKLEKKLLATKEYEAQCAAWGARKRAKHTADRADAEQTEKDGRRIIRGTEMQRREETTRDCLADEHRTVFTAILMNYMESQAEVEISVRRKRQMEEELARQREKEAMRKADEEAENARQKALKEIARAVRQLSDDSTRAKQLVGAEESKSWARLLSEAAKGRQHAISQEASRKEKDKQLLQNAIKKAHPFIGFTLVETTGPSRTLGLRVESIVHGGPAFTAGIQVGDVVTTINNVRCTTLLEARRVIAKCVIGSHVKIDAMRTVMAVESPVESPPRRRIEFIVGVFTTFPQLRGHEWFFDAPKESMPGPV